MEEHIKQEHTEIIKIAFVGPESTGKTTLASQLAEEFNTNWIPEFARDYLQDKWDLKQEICSREDLMPVSYTHLDVYKRQLIYYVYLYF